MAKVGAQRAAELTGKSKSTIQRAMNQGKLSYEVDNNKRRVIDVSELERVFGLAPDAGKETLSQSNAEAELEKANAELEMERLKMRIKLLETQLEAAETQIEDLKGQRDQWQKQAQQVLITSQYSQKQAEEYKTQLKEREERARKRKEQILAEKMKRMKGENENQTAPSQQTTQKTQTEETSAFDFQGLWQKIRGGKSEKAA